MKVGGLFSLLTLCTRSKAMEASGPLLIEPSTTSENPAVLPAGIVLMAFGRSGSTMLGSLFMANQVSHTGRGPIPIYVRPSLRKFTVLRDVQNRWRHGNRERETFEEERTV